MNKKSMENKRKKEFQSFRRIQLKTRIVSKVFVLGLAAFFLFSCSAKVQEEGSTEEASGAAPVKVIAVKRQQISEKIYYTGLIEAREKIVITPEVSGRIAKINVEEGDRVRKGDILAELDTKTVRLQLQQAEAGVAVAQANYNDARRNMERMERLRNENAVSEQQYEKVKLAFESAEAQLKQSEAAMDLAEHSLDVSIMTAPFSGVIASKHAEVGDIINPMMGGGYSTAIGVLTLVDFSAVKINIQVSLEDVVRIKKGQKASLTVTTFPNKVFLGKVTVVNMAADPASKKFGVEIQVQNPDLLLRPNVFGEVVLEISTHENALVVPQNSVVEDSYVFVAENGRAVKKKITIGLQNNILLEVVKGLDEGELVIVEGNYGLEDGAEIEVSEVLK